jgi:glucose/arabinose dehydrogenase
MRVIRGALVASFVFGVSTFGALGGDPPRVQAASVPAGFTDVAVGNFNSPTAVEWVAGELVVVLEKGGRIRIGRPGSGSFTTAIDIDVCTQSERGLLGFTHDPGFLTTRHVFVYYTAPVGDSCVNRVSRFHLGPNDRIDPASELVLLDNIASTGGNHNGGDLDVGSDGFLYVAVGDAGRDPRGDSGSAGANDAAQDLSLLNGKILRITRDGLPAAGNPLSGPGTARCATRGNGPGTPTTTCQEIFAWGLRNPYRFAFDRNDGRDRFHINDVGQGTMEEVDVGALGANYGWPVREGVCPQGQTPPCAGPPANLVDPITAYGRTTGRSITGGAFVPNGLWPAAYDGTYLFGDFLSGEIWRMQPNGSVDYGSPFATGADGMTDMTFGFDVDGRSVLYYTTFDGLRAIVPPAPQSASTGTMKLIPTAPVRVYDTGNGTGVAAGQMANDSTRLVDANPPAGYEAALVNLTYDATGGAGYLRAWRARSARPGTSSLNVDRPGAIVANAAIVPLDADGAFMIETTTAARVVIDVMAWFDETASTDDGRFVATAPTRAIDTRLAAGQALDSGSPNPWSPTPIGLDVDRTAFVDLPTDGTAEAVVLSVTAIAGPAEAGVLSVYPGGGTASVTSNVNIREGEVRANLVVVPLGADGSVSVGTSRVADVVIDMVGFITSDAAPSAGAGLYRAVETNRIVDTRIPLGFGTLQPNTAAGLAVPGAGAASAVAQNLTMTNTTAPGHLSAHPSATTPVVSNLNVNGPGEIRAVLAWTKLGEGGRMNYTSFARTDFVVDVLGFFT